MHPVAKYDKPGSTGATAQVWRASNVSLAPQEGAVRSEQSSLGLAR